MSSNDDEIGEKLLDAIMKLAIVSYQVEHAAKGGSATKDEHIETMILALSKEDDKFKESFIKGGHTLVVRQMKIADLKPFQWYERDRLTRTQEKELAEFRGYIYASVVQYVKFPNKAIRDKVRAAVSACQ